MYESQEPRIPPIRAAIHNRRPLHLLRLLNNRLSQSDLRINGKYSACYASASQRSTFYPPHCEAVGWVSFHLHETYRNKEKLSPLVRELPWTHNIIILSKCTRPEEREFYLRLIKRDTWDKRRLEREIDSALFERKVLSP